MPLKPLNQAHINLTLWVVNLANFNLKVKSAAQISGIQIYTVIVGVYGSL